MPKTIQKRNKKRITRPTPKPRLIKPKFDLPKIPAEEIVIVKVPSTPTKGTGTGGEKWRIDVNGVRVGEIYINVINEPPLGIHASIQIYLNIKNQGKGIGRIAYLKACQSSQHKIVFAHMRKSNISSRKAAIAAGFFDETPSGYTQLIMRRDKI